MIEEWEVPASVKVGRIIRDARIDAGITQAEVLVAMGKNPNYRAWIREVESGERYRGGPTVLSIDEYAKLAGLLGIDLVEILRTAGIPKSEWTDLSSTESIGSTDSPRKLTDLASRLEGIARELRRIPQTESESTGAATG